jgi:hypothetical protein
MATITLDIKSELPKAIRWTDTMTKQLPFAISQALNRTAFDMRDAMNGATRQYFKNPVPFTQRAFLVNRSSKRNLEAEVYAERRRARYLRTLISGGDRGQKPVELRYLAKAEATMPKDSRLVPATVNLTAAGNVSLATLKRIEGQIATKGKNSVFLGRPDGAGRPPGVYQRTAKGKLRPLFIAVPRARYEKIFPMAEIGQKVIDRRFGDYLRSSLEKAVASAR